MLQEIITYVILTATLMFVAYKIYEIMKKNYPLLSKYIECNYSQEELGRLKSEEKTEMRKSFF